MEKTRKKTLRHLALASCVIVFCVFLMGAAPSHTNDFYVNDYADVLTDETEAKILNTAVSLNNETTAQVVVLTVQSLDGEEISDYAVDVLRSWGIGSEDKDNGALIVLSVEERQVWVSVGYGLEGTLTDIRTGQLLDEYAVPYYRNDDFDTGTLELFNAVVSVILTEEYGLEALDGYYSAYQSENMLTDKSFAVFITIFIIIMSFPVLIYLHQILKILYLKRYDKKHGTSRALAYRAKLRAMKKANRNTGYGGGPRGGFGGGFHGGGFGGGGFSGGGGSGGGGGAGRGF